MIICCGESLIDMISIANAGNESVFAGLTGGAIFNTSIALGRLDVPVGLISGVSTDLFGKKITNDLTDSNVNIKLLIRNENGKKIQHNIDLTSAEFMQSPFYFLKQNDIVYVRPNNARVKSSGLVGNVGTLGTILSLAISIVLLITR